MRLQINMVVSSPKEAAVFYKELFEAEILSTTDLDKGQNETMMNLGVVEVKVLEENKDLMLLAPTPESMGSFWANLYVEDIRKVVKKAEELNCVIISPVVEYENGAINAVIRDKFNHIWVLNQ